MSQQRSSLRLNQGLTTFAVELIPRITRAQAMDALSSMATVAGYKAVMHRRANNPRMFPLLMTAAGTVPPARVLVLGAGVAGFAGDCHGAETWRGCRRLRRARGGG